MSFGAVAASYVAVMPTRFDYNFENAVVGQECVIDPRAGGGGTGLYGDGAVAAHGGVSVRADNTIANQYVQDDLPAPVSDVAVRFYIYQSEAATSDTYLLRLQADTTTYDNPTAAIRLYLMNGNRFRMRDNLSATIWTASAALTPLTWYRFEIRVQCGTSANAMVSGAYYSGDDTTPIQTFNLTTATTTAQIASVRIGRVATGTSTPTTGSEWYDDLAIDTAPTGLIGPYVP